MIGSQIASKAIVQEAIRARKDQAYRANHLCAEMVIGGLNEIAFAPTELLICDDGNSIDLADAKRLGLTHLIKKIRMTQTPFGQTTELEFYSRLDALKQLAHLGQIRISSQELDSERIRTNFLLTVQDSATKRGHEFEDEKRGFLAFYEENRPEFFDTLTRLGIIAESTADSAQDASS